MDERHFCKQNKESRNESRNEMARSRGLLGGAVEPEEAVSVFPVVSRGGRDPGRRVVSSSLCVVFVRWIVAPLLNSNLAKNS